LIPHRNISLLSNRLATNGGQRIREDVLERDYCLAWLLSALAQSDLRPVLASKGGTALKRCYFAEYRFSGDLDFTLRQLLPFEEIRARMEVLYATTEQQSGIIFSFDRHDPRLRTLWNKRLAYQMAILPPFEQVFREVRRTFRQAELPDQGA